MKTDGTKKAVRIAENTHVEKLVVDTNRYSVDAVEAGDGGYTFNYTISGKTYGMK